MLWTKCWDIEQYLIMRLHFAETSRTLHFPTRSQPPSEPIHNYSLLFCLRGLRGNFHLVEMQL